MLVSRRFRSRLTNLPKAVSTVLKETLLALRKDVLELPSTVQSKDPAARSALEILLLYPGVKAVLAHRIAHSLWKEDFAFSARAVSEISRFCTGVEIHPGATVGRRLVIDHGMGIVIGETAVIGDDVMLYQGVTLGGTANIHGKRHPSLEKGVIVGVGASVLGDIVVGEGARIGAGAVVLGSVAPGASVGGVPARDLRKPEGGAGSTKIPPSQSAPQSPAEEPSQASLPSNDLN